VGRIRVPGTIKAGSEWCVAAASQKKIAFSRGESTPQQREKERGGVREECLPIFFNNFFHGYSTGTHQIICPQIVMIVNFDLPNVCVCAFWVRICVQKRE